MDKIIIDGDKVVKGEKQIFAAYYSSGASGYPPDIQFDWKIILDKERNKEYFAGKLIEFYKSLLNGNFKENKILPFRDVILKKTNEDLEMSDEKLGIKEFSLEQLLENPNPIINHPLFNEFTLLRINTGYGIFCLGNSGKSWESNGKINIITLQNLSEPLSKLICETVSHKVSADEIKPVLMELYRRNGLP